MDKINIIIVLVIIFSVTKGSGNGMINYTENLTDTLESYLEAVEQRHWNKLAFIDINIMEEIQIENSNEAYQNLKKQFLEKQIKIKQKKISVQNKTIGESRQMEKVTLEDNGTKIIKIYATIVPNMKIENPDARFKSQLTNDSHNQNLYNQITIPSFNSLSARMLSSCCRISSSRWAI